MLDRLFNWNIVARLLQMALAGVGAYLIGKAGITHDFWDRASALVIEGAALIWANWHGSTPDKHSLARRAFRKIIKGGPPPAALALIAIIPFLSGCALWRSLMGDKALLAEKSAVVACAGADGAMDVLLLGNGASLVPNSLLCHLNSAKQKVAMACSLGSLAPNMSPAINNAMNELKTAKANALVRMPPKTVGTFIDSLVDLILRGAPSEENVAAARLAMQANLSLTSARWDARVAQACQ